MTVPTLTLTPLGGADDAPILVLGPSLGTSTILWERTVPELAERFRLLAWDLPGHGASPAADAPFSVADLADGVARAVRGLDALGTGDARIRYAGVSLGGATGLELLLRHPALVDSAAIIASGAQLGDPVAWRDRAARVRAQSTSSLIIGSAERWFAPGSMEREPDLSGRLLHALQGADDESYARCCEALADHDVRDRLAEIEQPVIAVWGEHDAVAPEQKAVEIARGVQRGTVEMVADAAHLPPAEQPGTTARALLGFFGAAVAR